jgi:3'-phosphoadenosine 5'-phosphosulfate sulfotransferase (PAPS reductase)/FAD synthetase
MLFEQSCSMSIAKPHPWPWIIGYSGGKDSTLVAHLVFEMLMSLPASAAQASGAHRRQ